MRSCDVLRVFTRSDVGGNHLGVIDDVADLDTESMQAIAAHLGFSETVFIDRRERDTPKVRIFTPAIEMPFAGHPLVGAAWSLRSEAVTALECAVGTIPVRVSEDHVEIDAPLVTDVRVADEAATVATGARLPEPRAAWWAMMPLPYLVLDVGSAQAVASASPEVSKLTALGAGKTYLVGRQGDDLRVRFFAPGAGVPEDPATGSAAAAWAAVRVFEGEATGAVTVHQGEEIGHPSTIHLEWTPGRVTLGGTVRRDGVQVIE